MGFPVQVWRAGSIYLSLLDSHIDPCKTVSPQAVLILIDSNKSTNSSIPGDTLAWFTPYSDHPHSNQAHACKPTTRPPKILSVSLQYIPAQKEVFWEPVDACAPAIIIANETYMAKANHPVKLCHQASIHRGKTVPMAMGASS